MERCLFLLYLYICNNRWYNFSSLYTGQVVSNVYSDDIWRVSLVDINIKSTKKPSNFSSMGNWAHFRSCNQFMRVFSFAKKNYMSFEGTWNQDVSSVSQTRYINIQKRKKYSDAIFFQILILHLGMKYVAKSKVQ